MWKAQTQCFKKFICHTVLQWCDWNVGIVQPHCDESWCLVIRDAGEPSAEHWSRHALTARLIKKWAVQVLLPYCMVIQVSCLGLSINTNVPTLFCHLNGPCTITISSLTYAVHNFEVNLLGFGLNIQYSFTAYGLCHNTNASTRLESFDALLSCFLQTCPYFCYHRETCWCCKLQNILDWEMVCKS